MIVVSIIKQTMIKQIGLSMFVYNTVLTKKF